MSPARAGAKLATAMHFRHRDTNAAAPAGEPAPQVVTTIDVSQLSGLFSAPQWLRDLGLMTWLVVGIALVLVGLVWLIGLTSSITIPVILGLVIASVASPAVDALQRRRLPRAAGAGIVLLGVVALGVVIAVLVIGGLASESGSINSALNEAMSKIEGWLKDVGVNSSDAANTSSNVKSAVSSIGSTLLKGVAVGISGLTSLFFTLTFAVFSTFFLLKDGPSMHRWVDGHLGLPEKVAGVVTGETLRALRQYFLGVTIVAAFNAIVVGLGALILGVPLAGTITVVTFVCAYVPFIGAWTAGAFAVLLALSGAGESEAIVMIVIVALANGMLQQIVQPIAFGATLGLNPLVVLIATIGGGALFGMIGLVLGAPLTSAAVHIAQRLGGERAAPAEEASAEPVAPPPASTPAPQPSS
jgi:predicted PurR-regulated permease PerM